MICLTARKEIAPMAFSQSSSLAEEECQKFFERGKEAGEEIGYRAAICEIKILLELLEKIATKLLDHKAVLLEKLKPEIIDFSIQLCERVIRKELSHPESLVKLINSLLAICEPEFRQDAIQIVLATDDFLMLEQHLEKVQYDTSSIVSLHFRADSLMKRGDCRIEAQSGLLNYSITRELADLQAKILQ
jgi:flagellar assembly protein FliH